MRDCGCGWGLGKEVEERGSGEMRKSIDDKEERKKRKNIERTSEWASSEHSTLPCPAPLSGDG